MQALTFGFGVGAFISPFLVAWLGTNAMIALAVLAIINAILVYR